MTTRFDRCPDGRFPLRGTYRPTRTEDGRRSAVIACPNCDIAGSLSWTHEIREDGCVFPSVVCDCGFHDFVILEGWDGLVWEKD